MKLYIVRFFVTLELLFRSLSFGAKSSRTGITTAGDIIIGGLIPVHFSPNFAPHPGNSSCRGAFHRRGYKGVEAMLYAVKLINSDPTLLPRVTLGVDIKDTCGSVDYAIMESLSFDFIRSAFTASEVTTECAAEIHSSGQFKINGTSSTGSVNSTSPAREESNVSECCSSKPRTAAIVGAAFSGVTMATASLTGLFHVPVISYASTSRLLSDRSRFQYFYRTVPSDNLQAQAMTDLLHKLKWHFLIILASDNEYGRSGITALKQTIHSHAPQRVCVVVDELFSRKGTEDEMASIFKKIEQFKQARVIILYAEFPDAVYFFKEAKKASLRDYMFIASDSWVGSSEVVQGTDGVFHSIIGLRPPVISIPKFESYFMDRLHENATGNPWAADLNKSLICDDKSLDKCHSDVHHDGYVPYIMDAVFSVAHALHAMLSCSEEACARKWSDADIDFRELSRYIQNVSFAGFSQQSIFFNEEGSTRGQYDIYHLRKGGLKYEKVGNWSGIASPNLSRISEHGTFLEFPTSICSNDCKKGEHKIPKSQFPECCWDCAKCDGKSFTNTSRMPNCIDCPEGTWPTADHSDCSPIEAGYLHWSEAWAVVIVFLSLFGLGLVVCTCVIFIKFRGTAVVRAASRQLCHVLLVGIAMFYVTPLPYVAKPSVFSCKVLPFMFGLCFVLVVGTILIRTNRVSRIFNEKLLQTGKIGCLGNHWQLFILGCLLTTELALSIFWVFGSSIQMSAEIIYSQSSKDASLVCNLTGSKIGFSLWLIYNAGLVVVCTYQAFLVRKVPQNYNESRLIAFNMTTICITVLVYIPSYMGTTDWYRTVISSFMFLFLGTLTWASIFAPKIYIILFRPHKNIPMRPSVSSITLGVITPSPTVLSNLSDQGTRSRQNSLSPNEDDSCERLWANCDSSRDVNENEAPDERKDSREMSPAGLADDVGGKCSENEQTETRPEMKTKKANQSESRENPETARQKKTSVVHFEDEVTTENPDEQNKDKQVTGAPGEKTSTSQGGILRKTYLTSRWENLENLSNGVSVKKKKTSLVRFQDEVTNCQLNGPDCHRVALPAKREEPDQVSDSENNFNEDNWEERVLDCSCVPNFSSGKRDSGKGVADQGRKRKISVYSFQ